MTREGSSCSFARTGYRGGKRDERQEPFVAPEFGKAVRVHRKGLTGHCLQANDAVNSQAKEVSRGPSPRISIRTQWLPLRDMAKGLARLHPFM